MNLREMLENAVDTVKHCGAKPRAWLAGSEFYYEILKSDVFDKGKVLNIPIYYKENMKKDEICLMTDKMYDELNSRPIKNMPGKKIILPKWRAK